MRALLMASCLLLAAAHTGIQFKMTRYPHDRFLLVPDEIEYVSSVVSQFFSNAMLVCRTRAARRLYSPNSFRPSVMRRLNVTLLPSDPSERAAITRRSLGTCFPGTACVQQYGSVSTGTFYITVYIGSNLDVSATLPYAMCCCECPLLGND